MIESGTPTRGDIVVYRQGNEERISRVVGQSGDRLESVEGRLVVNGVPAEEPYLAPGMTTTLNAAVEVPAGRYFLLGDNRTNSRDSRTFGGVPAEDIVGVARRSERGDEECEVYLSSP